EVASRDVRIPDDQDLQDINRDATAFVTSNNTGTYLRQVHDPGTKDKLAEGPAPNQVVFSPAGRLLFIRYSKNRQLAFFTLNPLKDTGIRYHYDSRYDRFSWASDDTVRIVDTQKRGDLQLVDAGSGKERY